VATLSLHSLFELRSMLLNGTVLLDMEASTLEQVADLFIDNMIGAGTLSFEKSDKVSFYNLDFISKVFFVFFINTVILDLFLTKLILLGIER
jgi:hypothetical protein